MLHTKLSGRGLGTSISIANNIHPVGSMLRQTGEDLLSRLSAALSVSLDIKQKYDSFVICTCSLRS